MATISAYYEFPKYIANGTIDTAMIGELVVTNAKIASMSVAKLTAGSLAVGEYIQSTGFVTTISGFKIDGNGNAEFNGPSCHGFEQCGQLGGTRVNGNIRRMSRHCFS